MDRKTRLAALNCRAREVQDVNRKEKEAEDERMKQEKNLEAKKRRLEWEEKQDCLRKECDESGENYSIAKLRDLGADEVEKMEKRKKRKNPDQGFSDYEQATFRQYQRLTKQIKPNLQEYEAQKEKLGDEIFYPSADTLGVTEHKDSEEAVSCLVDDLDKQIKKRAKYSRRRAYDEDEDIDYINERNMKFNKKLERFYGKYTTEIKQNLERGTAI
jgi:pre-mRNA-splicing factor SYF2